MSTPAEKRKSNSSDSNEKAPKGLGVIDDQGNSNTCVRFSLSKAIANSLFLEHKIDVDQGHIMISLVQEWKELFDPLAPTDPSKFDNTVLYLQDKGNCKPGLEKERCWWKVISTIRFRNRLNFHRNHLNRKLYIIFDFNLIRLRLISSMQKKKSPMMNMTTTMNIF